ncbi:MAG TPA: transcription antitermination factor NusB [Candidatus Peribacteraceae bacterium]|nr:transcription antitermination factor NusB [Candidatus Peribacteraceae bacterium]
MARRRHLSRIAVMQVLFEREKRPEIDTEKSLGLNEVELGEVDREFADVLLKGVTEHYDDICKAIQDHAPGWTLDRMDPVSRCVLCVGAYEMMYSKDAPAAVIINEAIDIAKEFGTDEAGKFVNGVLNAMIEK